MSINSEYTVALQDTILMRPRKTIQNHDYPLDISAWEESAVVLKLSLNLGLQSCGELQRTCFVLRGLPHSGPANCHPEEMGPRTAVSLTHTENARV